MSAPAKKMQQQLLKPILKLHGPNRRVWFLTEDGETISHIRDNTRTYKFGGSSQTSDSDTGTDTNAAKPDRRPGLHGNTLNAGSFRDSF